MLLRKIRPFLGLEVIFVKDMLYAILAVITAVVAGFSFYRYTSGDGQPIYIVLAIVFALVTVVLGGLVLSGRVNKNDDIHITE
jgi:CDP-diglyceride synthetase